MLISDSELKHNRCESCCFPQLEPGLSLDDEYAVEIRFVVKCKGPDQQQDLLHKLKLTSDMQ
jgi:hypothetical protein